MEPPLLMNLQMPDDPKDEFFQLFGGLNHKHLQRQSVLNESDTMWIVLSVVFFVCLLAYLFSKNK